MTAFLASSTVISVLGRLYNAIDFAGNAQYVNSWPIWKSLSLDGVVGFVVEWGWISSVPLLIVTLWLYRENERPKRQLAEAPPGRVSRHADLTIIEREWFTDLLTDAGALLKGLGDHYSIGLWDDELWGLVTGLDGRIIKFSRWPHVHGAIRGFVDVASTMLHAESDEDFDEFNRHRPMLSDAYSSLIETAEAVMQSVAPFSPALPLAPIVRPTYQVHPPLIVTDSAAVTPVVAARPKRPTVNSDRHLEFEPVSEWGRVALIKVTNVTKASIRIGAKAQLLRQIGLDHHFSIPPGWYDVPWIGQMDRKIKLERGEHGFLRIAECFPQSTVLDRTEMLLEFPEIGSDGIASWHWRSYWVTPDTASLDFVILVAGDLSDHLEESAQFTVVAGSMRTIMITDSQSADDG